MIPMSVLRQAPFNLIYGQIVRFRISAYNVNGWSETTVSSNVAGTTVRTEPITMTIPQRGGDTTEQQIQIIWAPLLNVEDIGNSAILSYGMQWDAGVTNGPWINLVGYSSNSMLTSFTVTQGVVAGVVYNFRVQARNVYGWGPFSQTVVSATTVPS